MWLNRILLSESRNATTTLQRNPTGERGRENEKGERTKKKRTTGMKKGVRRSKGRDAGPARPSENTKHSGPLTVVPYKQNRIIRMEEVGTAPRLALLRHSCLFNLSKALL